MSEEVFDSSAVRLGPPPIVLHPPPKSRDSSSRRAGSRSPIRLPLYMGPQPTVEDILADDSLTYSQKQLAARIDRAAARIKTWCEELENWKWTGSFAPPTETHRNEITKVVTGAGNFEQKKVENDKETIWWGTLPAVVVEEHENRLDSIHDELVSFDLDDLKERVLDITHNNSRPSSSSSSWTVSSVTYVDDFSYFVTRTLILALPQLTSLNRYLKIWTSRLSVLRMVPTYLENLGKCQKHIVDIWRELDQQVNNDDDSIDKEQERLDRIRESYQSRLFNTSSMLDAMLDTLEGHDDVLPDNWIDDFEVLEADLSNWSVAVQNKILELRLGQHESNLPKPVPQPEQESEKLESILPQEKNGTENEDTINLTSSNGHNKILPNSNDQKVSNGTLITSATNHEQLVPLKNLEQLNGHDSTKSLHLAEESINGLSEKIQPPNTAAQPNQTVSKFVDSEVVELEPIASEKEVDTVEDSPPTMAHIQTTQLSTQTLPMVEGTRSDTTTFSDPDSPIDTTVVHHEPELEPDFDFDDDMSILEELSNIYEISDDDDDSIYGRELEESPSQRKQPVSRVPKPPLNSMMRKRQEKPSLPIISTPSTSLSTPRKLKKLSVKDANRQRDSELLSPVSPVLPLEQQISKILDTISTPIRLKSGPSANAPYIKSSRPLRSPTPNSLRRTISSQNAFASGGTNTPPVSRPGSRVSSYTQNSGSTPILTLAPAGEIPGNSRSERKQSRTSSASGTNVASSRRIHDPDVQLYHLIQTGRAHPIKLFIRRVGENGERVMVRVGGGWADLAEYLKVFAQHHGRRVVSDGGSTVEVLALGNSTGSSDGGSRVNSGRNTPVQPGSSENVRLRRSSTTSNPASNGPPLVPTISTDNPETPTSNPNSSRRPSLVQDPSGSASSLAGPFAKKRTGEISDEKQEWVDGIIEQAKRSLGKEMDVGDLGKKGGTRRIFFRKGVGE